jgi:hypothetical protein
VAICGALIVTVTGCGDDPPDYSKVCRIGTSLVVAVESGEGEAAHAELVRLTKELEDLVDDNAETPIDLDDVAGLVERGDRLAAASLRAEFEAEPLNCPPAPPTSESSTPTSVSSTSLSVATTAPATIPTESTGGPAATGPPDVPDISVVQAPFGGAIIDVGLGDSGLEQASDQASTYELPGLIYVRNGELTRVLTQISQQENDGPFVRSDEIWITAISDVQIDTLADGFRAGLSQLGIEFNVSVLPSADAVTLTATPVDTTSNDPEYEIRVTTIDGVVNITEIRTEKSAAPPPRELPNDQFYETVEEFWRLAESNEWTIFSRALSVQGDRAASSVGAWAPTTFDETLAIIVAEVPDAVVRVDEGTDGTPSHAEIGLYDEAANAKTEWYVEDHTPSVFVNMVVYAGS